MWEKNAPIREKNARMTRRLRRRPAECVTRWCEEGALVVVVPVAAADPLAERAALVQEAAACAGGRQDARLHEQGDVEPAHSPILPKSSGGKSLARSGR